LGIAYPSAMVPAWQSEESLELGQLFAIQHAGGEDFRDALFESRHIQHRVVVFEIHRDRLRRYAVPHAVPAEAVRPAPVRYCVRQRDNEAVLRSPSSRIAAAGDGVRPAPIAETPLPMRARDFRTLAGRDGPITLFNSCRKASVSVSDPANHHGLKVRTVIPPASMAALR
jgi:hypothetical protein